MSSKKLMIIDGNSLLHRAFYALPPLSTAEGIYTNGVYGFLTMFYKVIDEYKPDYISVVFDKKGPTFRHKEFADYKAGRAKTPDELLTQFPILKEVLDKLNISRLELDGFEADDLAGTLVKMGEEQGLNVIAVSGDKDYLQLASEKTSILLTRKGITELEIYDYDEVVKRYEMTPKQFIDLKGLMGDKSDNIPGVPGIGEKTGVKLLKEFKTIEGIYENIDSLRGKMKENLVEYRNQAFMSRRLSEIITTIPLNIDIEDMKIKEPNYEEISELYQKLEFKSLLEKIGGNYTDNKSEEIVELEYKIIDKIEDVEKVYSEIKKSGELTFKTSFENNPLTGEVLGLAIKYDPKDNYYINLEEIDKEVFFDISKEILEDRDIKKISHNIKEDIIILLRYGIDLQGIDFDSMIAQYLINPSQSNYDINLLTKEYLKRDIHSEEDILGKGKSKNFKDLDIEETSKFFVNIVDSIFNIRPTIEIILKEQEMEELFYDVEIPLATVLADMEYRGFTVDLESLKELGNEFDKKIEILTAEIYKYSETEFNINSPKQLGEILFNKLELPVIKKTKTGYSTNAEVLEKLIDSHPIVEKILEYRQIVKLKSTYVDGLINVMDKNTNKVHSSFNQTITTTGRISSTEPNLQNIPIRTEEGRKIRKVFIPKSEDYTLADADYSQIELRVLAHLSNDPKLIEAFFTGEDIHRRTASEVFDVPLDEVTSTMRSNAKAVNFGIIYGISDFGLSRDLNISRKQSKEYIDNYFERYTNVKGFMDSIIKDGKKKGYVETILKRRRYLPELSSRNFNIRSFGERMAMNTPIQGSAADIIKVAMVGVYYELKQRKLKSRLILQVHDELIVEAYKDEIEEVKELLRNIMEKSIKLNVPLKVDMKTGDSWYETK
ncbi:DNA polymerase I [Gottschalkia acidurici 9a]|uniref:DNA polymerase I n=1 Tax=Gottschalkia acidurici (strain ATCC 7906 / DSM 604 / BCRC 14475 / CIP 104303 / KCTC 5404 / NCIMB 10678 / 9a) TaxID=1128398 RepID=K0AXU1_GOTA9|nr:DNA polymerase I [Gottschalkia acidurici 9a]